MVKVEVFLGRDKTVDETNTKNSFRNSGSKEIVRNRFIGLFVFFFVRIFEIISDIQEYQEYQKL